MSAAPLNLYIEQGATWDLDLIWRAADGTPKDLTGYSVRATARHRKGSSHVLFSFDSATPTAGYTFGPLNATGRILVTLSAAVTAALTSDGVYDLDVVSPSGRATRLVEGAVSVSLDV